MNPKRFFAELKRRNVYKVAVAYAVVAWLLIQLAAILFPTFEAPAWVMKVFIAIVALGFPLALILAWAFELTPEGLKRTGDVARGESIARTTGRKLDFAIISVLVLAVALLLFDRFRPKPPPQEGGNAEKSIAVLPFENLSRDPENAFFATGVQDEILTRLAKVGELKVISRTSTQQYQSRPGNLREIAQQLGVAHIVEGSVQRAADSVRVNVQLIKADTDAHLWAETYDRKLSEIFEVQSDIALQIAKALEAKLTGRERSEIVTVGTTNQQAYDAYLRGLALDTAQTGEETRISLESFRKAVELDPDFALAWAALANRESFRYFSNNRTPEQLARARNAMEMAMKLQPDASESYAAAGSFYYYCPQNFDRALEMLAKARARAPNNAFVLMVTGAVKRRQGKVDESIALMRQAGILDPRNNDIWVNLARSYRGQRKFTEAHAMFDHARTIAAREEGILAEKAEAYTAAGDLDSAERLLAPLPLDLDHEAFDDFVNVFVVRRDFDRAFALLAEGLQKPTDAESKFFTQLQVAYLQAQVGRLEEAKPVLLEARQRIKGLRAAGDESLWLRDELLRLAATLGDRETVEREGKELLEITARDKWRHPVSEATVGGSYALLGDADRAIPHLERAIALPAQQGLTPAHLRMEPFWDKIRDDPRFQKLAAGN
ncbi:MAG: hypothetical protein M3372_07325 [Verrucomicrobiota bacterium]|nr:hypothetical protein [Verrucomicrobiota bacterium]